MQYDSNLRQDGDGLIRSKTPAYGELKGFNLQGSGDLTAALHALREPVINTLDGTYQFRGNELWADLGVASAVR